MDISPHLLKFCIINVKVPFLYVMNQYSDSATLHTDFWKFIVQKISTCIVDTASTA